MDLIIYTGAQDKTQAAVTSVTDTTPVASLEQFVLGDNPLITVKFTDGTAYEAWSGATGYTLTLGYGALDVAGQADYTNTSSFAQIADGWSGRISLNTTQLVNALALAVGNAVTWTQFPKQARVPFPRFNLGYFFLQVQVTDPSGYAVTYAELRVPLMNRVLPQGATTTLAAVDAIYNFLRGAYVQNRTLVGVASAVEDSTLLCGIPTVASIPVGAKIIAAFPNDIEAMFEFVASTSTSAGFLFQPFDYNATTNPNQWLLRRVWQLGDPCTYNATTTKWHAISAAGSAGAVYLAADQTGVALPT